MSTTLTSLRRSYNEHKGSLYFWDWDERRGYTIEQDQLVEDFESITNDSDEKIIQVTIYKTPLSTWQLTQAVLYHAFVVLETENWYYSLEISEKCVTMQRSKSKEDVRDSYPRERLRNVLRGDTPERIRRAKGKKTMSEVMKYIVDNEILDRNYEVLVDDGQNCQTFANSIFRHFTKL
ncbi:unnamed protein product [Adineta ricciae]|uniref:Uncharacterized protein n=1 Tax=Adineta ricciae TaxID=249248 RepID=A0A813QD47_ADIRI|nr:unnamed protein product [Adineta ricciae]CAF1236945.1 unnamed protein product [Adineta ricciae]